MNKLIKIVFLLLILANITYAQELKDGTYKFTMAFEEYATRDLDTTCTVIIKGNYITVLHDGNTSISGKKGDTLDKGIILKHRKTGKLIIGTTINDELADEIGGCTGGPNIIDLKNKIFWTC